MSNAVAASKVKEIEPLLVMSGLAFEEENHVYTLDGIEIPSVSTVMEPLRVDYYGGINQKILEQAADKGTAVHNCIENWIKYEIDDIPGEHRPYFNGFLEWWNQYLPVVVGSEIRMYHKLLRYGGTGDLLCYIGEKLVLIDFKTTWNLSDMLCRVQLEAYEQALASHGIHVDEKYILHLKRDGKWKFKQFPAKDTVAWRVFGSLKCVYDYIQSYK